MKSIDITTGPETSETAQAAFGAITNWAVGARSFWLTLWHRLKVIPRVLLYIGLLVLVITWLPSSNESNSVNIDAAHAILDHGVDATNERQAIALILALDSHYNPHPDKPKPIIKHLYFYIFASIVILIVWAFPPSTIVGLWAGEHILSLVKWWARLVWITTPVTVFGMFVTPFIQNYFSSR